MNRLFEESLLRVDEPLLPSASWTPATDVIETRDAFVVQVELPGISRDEVEVRVDGTELAVFEAGGELAKHVTSVFATSTGVETLKAPDSEILEAYRQL